MEVIAENECFYCSSCDEIVYEQDGDMCESCGYPVEFPEKIKGEDK